VGWLPKPEEVGVRTGEVRRGGMTSTTSTNLPNLPNLLQASSVLRQRRERRCPSGRSCGSPAAGYGRSGPRLSGLRDSEARNGGRLVRRADAAYGRVANRPEVRTRGAFTCMGARSACGGVVHRRRTIPWRTHPGIAALPTPPKCAVSLPATAPLSCSACRSQPRQRQLVHCPILLFHGERIGWCLPPMGKACGRRGGPVEVA